MVTCTTRPPDSSSAICRATSYSSDSLTELNELRFLISTLVPNAAWPTGRTLTLASQRMAPFSMSAELMSR